MCGGGSFLNSFWGFSFGIFVFVFAKATHSHTYTGRVIKGWDTGVATMKKGEKCILTCAPSYAYGARGSPPKIPPNATLEFEVELFSWKSQADVTEDGLLQKYPVKTGSGWKKPKAPYRATVRFAQIDAVDSSISQADAEAALEGAQVLEYVIGSGDKAALDAVLTDMKEGEIVKLVAGSDKYTLDGNSEAERTAYVVSLDGWAKVEDLSPEGDGSIVATFISDGVEYTKPRDGASVQVSYTIAPEGDQDNILASADAGSPLAFDVDGVDEDVPAILDLLVRQLAKTGSVSALVTPNWVPEAVVAAAQDADRFVVLVTLIEFENEPYPSALTPVQRLEQASKRKAEGNALFGRKDFVRAAAKYQKALSYYADGPSGQGSGSDSDNEGGDDGDEVQVDEEEKNAIILSCHLNNAACLLKTKDGNGAFAAASEALTLDPDNVKGNFRRGRANMLRQEFADAVADFERVLELDPENTAAQAGVKKAKVKAAALKKKEKAMYAKMFG